MSAQGNYVLDILQYCMSGGFWHWIGCFLIMGLAAQVCVATVAALCSFRFVGDINTCRREKSGESPTN